MQLKQLKYIRGAYVILATLCIAFVPTSAYAAELPSTLPTAVIKAPDYDANAGYYNLYATTITVTNNSGSVAKQVLLNDGTTFPNIYIDFVGYSSPYQLGRLNGYDYLYNPQGLLQPGETKTFNVRLNYHTPVNNVGLKVHVDDAFNASPASATYSSAGGYSLYTQSLAPPDYPKRIISTSQAGQLTSNIVNTIKDNFWAILGVLAFGLGLLLVNRWLEKREMGVRRV